MDKLIKAHLAYFSNTILSGLTFLLEDVTLQKFATIGAIITTVFACWHYFEAIRLKKAQRQEIEDKTRPSLPDPE